MKRTRMKRQSSKGAARQRQYLKQRAEWLPGRTCEGRPFADGWGVECAGGEGLELTVQHKQGRVGDLLFDEAHWAAMCWPCHHHVDTHPEDGRQAGLVERRGRVSR